MRHGHGAHFLHTTHGRQQAGGPRKLQVVRESYFGKGKEPQSLYFKTIFGVRNFIDLLEKILWEDTISGLGLKSVHSFSQKKTEGNFFMTSENHNVFWSTVFDGSERSIQLPNESPWGSILGHSYLRGGGQRMNLRTHQRIREHSGFRVGGGADVPPPSGRR